MRGLRIIIAFFISFLLIQTSFAQNCAKISLYRPNVYTNSLSNLTIYVNNVKVGVLANNAALHMNVPTEGRYDITAKWGLRGEMYREGTLLEVNATCNNVYYIHIKSGAFEASSLLNLVHQSIGKPAIDQIPSFDQTTIDIQSGGASIASTPVENPAPIEKKPEIKPVVTQPTRTGGNTPQPREPQQRITTRGKSYALIIAVNEYRDYSMNDLDQPIADATKLHDVLINKYTFTENTVTFLKDPTKNEITHALDKLYERLRSEDNLLIFYAGHGYWDEKFQQGYWLASDATRNNRGTWLSNGSVRDYIRAIPTKHTLLITDACFGGGIFKSRAAFANSSTAINQLYSLPSRKAMTSGAMSEVPDKSVFIHYLVKRLEDNNELYLSSEQLFASFKIAVINNSANGQVPQYGEVRETGDEGGDYIFIRKK